MAYNQKRGTLFQALASVVTLFSISKSGEIPAGTVAHFNLTDCPDGWVPFAEANGRFILGAGEYQNTTYQLGNTGGEVNHTLSIDEIPTHNHAPNGYNGLLKTSADNGAYGCKEYSPGQASPIIPFAGILSMGGGVPHNNLPQYYVLTPCKKIYNPNETIGIRTENPNPKNALDVNGSVAINGSINIAKNGNVTANILCALNKECVSVKEIATKQDCSHATDNTTTTNVAIGLSVISTGMAAVASFFVCTQKVKNRELEQRLHNLENQANNPAVQNNPGGIVNAQTALL